LGLFEAEVYNIPPGAKHLMGIVENSHRADDECFLIPQGEWFIPLSFGLQVLSHYPFCFMVVNIFVSGAIWKDINQYDKKAPEYTNIPPIEVIL